MPKTKPNPDTTVEAAAEMLGVSPRAVHGLLSRKRFPNARKVNPEKKTSAWLIPIADIKRYQKNRRAHSETE